MPTAHPCPWSRPECGEYLGARTPGRTAIHAACHAALSLCAARETVANEPSANRTLVRGRKRRSRHRGARFRLSAHRPADGWLPE